MLNFYLKNGVTLTDKDSFSKLNVLLVLIIAISLGS